MFLAASRVCQYRSGHHRPERRGTTPVEVSHLSARIDRLDRTIRANQEAQRQASDARWREMSRQSNRRIGLGIAAALGICAGSIAINLYQDDALDWY